jgi:hypothetical protein
VRVGRGGRTCPQHLHFPGRLKGHPGHPGHLVILSCRSMILYIMVISGPAADDSTAGEFPTAERPVYEAAELHARRQPLLECGDACRPD